MKKFAAIPFLILSSCIIEVPNEVIEPTFTPIEDVSGNYTTETMLLDISDISCRENVRSVTDGTLTMDFNRRLYKSGSDSCIESEDWGSFPDVEGSNPHRLVANGNGSVSIWLSKPVSKFGVEIRPEGLGLNNIRVRFYSKTKLIGVINKTHETDEFDIPEAILVAASTNDVFEHIVIDGINTETGFSLAQFRYVLD